MGLQSFDKLFLQTNRKVTAYVSRRISWDVEDIVDDIYTTAWRRRSDMPTDEQEVLIWLLAIGRRVIANKIRWRSRLDRFNKLNNPLVVSADSNQNDGETWVHEALAALPNNQREALMLVEWDGLANTEAAMALSVPETTLTKRLHSARETFARAYLVIEEREK